MHRFLITTIALLFCLIAGAQPTHFSGTINSQELEAISFVKLGLNSYLRENVNFEMPVKAGKFSGSFNVQEMGMYRIGDGWTGHHVFLTPGDTVQLVFERIPQKKNKDGTPAIMPVFHKLTAKTKYPAHYTYFDEVNGFFGWTVYPFKKDRFKPEKFRFSCDSAYSAARGKLENYHNKKLVSDTFYRYALGELDSRYILWLCTPLTYFEKALMPPDYFDNISIGKFDDLELLKRTDSYVTAASVYNVYVLNEHDPENWYNNLDNEFNTASTYFSGILRERLMAWCLKDYKDKDFESFDSLYQYFLADCTNPRIRREVYIDVEAYRRSERNKPPLDSMLSALVLYDSRGQSFSFDQIKSEKKWMVIDCWASWCVPCKKQLPYIHAFEKQFKDSIQFVYLSFDESSESWKKAVLENKHAKSAQFLVKDGFKSLFAKYFNVKAIPRYILLNTAEGKVENKDLPTPSQQRGFERAIRSVLEE